MSYMHKLNQHVVYAHIILYNFIFYIDCNYSHNICHASNDYTKTLTVGSMLEVVGRFSDEHACNLHIH